jgi:hypothetical protein
MLVKGILGHPMNICFEETSKIKSVTILSVDKFTGYLFQQQIDIKILLASLKPLTNSKCCSGSRMIVFAVGR